MYNSLKCRFVCGFQKILEKKKLQWIIRSIWEFFLGFVKIKIYKWYEFQLNDWIERRTKKIIVCILTRELNRNAFASCAHTAMAINDRRAPTTTNERTNETSNSNEWREEKRTKKEKHTITLAEGKKTTHIAFINIIKSLCAAAILNSTVFFFISRFTSFSLSLCQFSYAIPFGTLARCVVVILFFLLYYEGNVATSYVSHSNVFFSSFSICFFFRFIFYYFANYTRRMCTKWHAFVVFDTRHTGPTAQCMERESYPHTQP